MTNRFTNSACILVLLLGALSAGCSDGDPTGSGGEGSLSFTTWGEEYVEDEIPEDPGDGSGFIDGWTVVYSKFLVNFGNLVVSNQAGETAATLAGSKLFDNKVPGVKTVIEFQAIPAKAWDLVSYEIAPVTDTTELDASATEDDKALMLDGGYSLFVSGTATKGDVEKQFSWGFRTATLYDDCESEQGGRNEAGVVVTNNSTTVAELTTHGDHLFYDRLQASPDPAVRTSLRFDALADADEDEDDEVTLEELDATLLDVRRYDSSGFGASNFGEFVTSLARTVGHFRGEGECHVSAL
jgi:hypothetical protein